MPYLRAVGDLGTKVTAERVVERPHRVPATPNVGTRWRLTNQGIAGLRGYVFLGHGLMVVSSTMDAEYRGLVGPHNHVSASIFSRAPKEQRRISDEWLDLVRRDFDMEDAEEDNHSSGIGRHLFLPLWLPRGTTGICECKADEAIIVEPDGYIYSAPK
jgi:hypothetical protein